MSLAARMMFLYLGAKSVGGQIMPNAKCCMTLYEETLLLVKERKNTITYAQIHADTNLGVSWLKKFASGNAPNSSIRSVQKLNDYLKA
jgi:hypothetical protein